MTLNLMRSLILISLPFYWQTASAPAVAQITPDNTLGAESSVVTPNVNINGISSERIDGGAIRDTNLFHSFQELNVGEGRGAYFSNPSGIENILGRVTGINRSNILGTLGVLGNANLFLINPNGILFGPNARLDLRGSFVGSTANSLMFDNGFEFSATNPQAPPLLTVNIPIGLRFREPAASVLVQGVGQNLGLNGATASFAPAFGGLRVQPGETLTLAGGNVLLDGGILEAPGGRVELGGLDAAGTLALNVDASLNFSDTVASGDVTLTNRSGINVLAGGGGNIGINAQNIDISGESLLTTGIGSNQGFDGSQAGNIQLTAIGDITIAASRIENNVNPDAIGGNSGDINTIAVSRFSADSVQLSTSTFEGGIAGNIGIGAGDVEITNSLFTSDAFESGIGGQAGIIATFGTNQVTIANSEITTDSVGGDASGQAGGIGIEGRDILIDSSALSTTAFDEGFAGAVLINASNTVAIANSRILSDTSGAGDAGNILIEADSLLDIFNSFVTSEVLTSAATGNAGTITFTADTVAIANSNILSDSRGSGNAGNILIEADGLLDIADGFITSEVLNSEATGNSGTITLRANSIFLSESAPNPELPSLQTTNQGAGNAGNITIEAVDTVALDGGQIFSDASNSTGLAGDIEIDAGNEIFIGSQSNISSEGRFGRIFIGESLVAPQFSPPTRVRIDGASLTTNNSGLGVAGDIVINASEEIAISQSTISSNGEFGRIFIGKSTLFPESTSPRRVTIDGTSLTTNNSASSADANEIINAGNVSIDAIDSIDITNGSRLEALTTRRGDAGNITLRTENGEVSLLNTLIFTTVDTGVVGNGGNIDITTGSLFLSSGAQLLARTFGQGNPGNVTITATDTVSFDGVSSEQLPSGAFSNVEETGVSNGDDTSAISGNIDITTGSLFVTNGGQLQGLTRGEGDAGRIRITATELVSFDGLASNGNPSGAFSTVDNGAVGNGGIIDITTSSLFVTNGAEVQSLVRPEAVGNGGDINITVESLSLTNDARLVANNFSSGLAGNVDIETSQQVSIVGSSITSTSNNDDVSGFSEIRIIVPEGSINLNQATVDNTNSGSEFAGDIVINAREDISIANESTISSNGRFGRILIGEFEDSSESFSPRRVMIDGASRLTTNNSAVDLEPDVSILAGDVSITATDRISLSNGSTLEASTSRRGSAGRVILEAETVSFDGVTSDGGLILPSGAFTRVDFNGIGDGGDIEITADRLSVTNGAQLQALTEGIGDAGRIILEAENVSFDGVASNDINLFPSGAFTTVTSDGIGDGGDIEITADRVSVTNGAQLQGLTRGLGLAGNVNIRATNTVSFDGVISNKIGISRSGAFSTVEARAIGDGGDININADRLSITNGAELSSSSEFNQNNGTAGNINIVADTTRISNGTISSNTVGGEGNINLRSRALVLRRGSEISASASGEVNGGNITINSGVLAALENSDIRANATQGFGGEVRIEAQGVFGTEFREENTIESDITATSELGREFFGIVELNTPDVDPSRGLVTLPVNVVDPASLIADNPCQEGEGSEFTVTGRGGLPSNPGESLRRDAVRVDLVEPAQSGAEEQGEQEEQGNRGEKQFASSSTAEKIVPAQGWVSNEKGEVVLTAYAPTSTTPQRPWRSPNPACPAP